MHALKMRELAMGNVRTILATTCLIALGATIEASSTATAQGTEQVQRAAFDKAVLASKRAMTSDPITAQEEARIAEQNAGTTVNGLATALWLQSEALTRQDKASDAIPRIARARRYIAEEDRTLRGDLLLSEARALGQLNDDGIALASFQDAYTLFEELGNERKTAISLQGIATLYTTARRYDRALDYYERAIAAYPSDVGMTYAARNNIAKIFLETGRFDDAIPAFKDNLALASKLGHAKHLALTNALLAETYARADRIPEARAYLATAKIHDDHPTASLWAPYLKHVEALVADFSGDTAAASRHYAALFEGYDFAVPDASYRIAHHSAAEHYAGIAEFETAYQHHVAFKGIDDQKSDDAARNNFALLNAEFETANKTLDIERLERETLEASIAQAAITKKAEVEAARQKERSRTLIFAILSIGVTLLIALLLAYTRHITRSREKQSILAEQAIEANKAKDEFLASISHEIRTPLNGILGFAEIMMTQGMVEGEAETMMRTMHDSGKDLLAIVNDLLDLAKMEAGKMTVELEPSDIARAISGAADAHRGTARQKGLAIEINVDDQLPHFVTDPLRMRQAVSNLVGNAVKFTDSGSITIDVSAMPGRGFEVAVKDTGIGIPSDQLDKVFEGFGQVKGQDRAKYGGTGLGLALVKNVARLLGGDVEVDSKLGYGTTFIMRIPAEKATAPDRVATPPQRREAQMSVTSLRDVPRDEDGTIILGDLRILYAEDNAVNVLVFSGMVGKSVASIEIAEDGAKAVDMVQRAPFDAVFMDNNMPRMDGIEATRAIRALPGVGGIPIIGCTADAVPEIHRRMIEAGMNDVVSKPVTTKTLLTALDRVFASDWTQEEPVSQQRS